MEDEKEAKESREKEMAMKKARRLVLPSRSRYTKKHGKDTGGSADLQPYHRRKLRAVLAALLEQRVCAPASGVVSVLLGAGCRSDQLYQHRDLNYFWAAMEVMRQIEGTKANSLKFKRLYRILHRKQLNPRLGGEVQLELALYLMSQGDYDSYEAAYNEIRPIVDVAPFRDDPVVNLCHGLTLHRLWHDRAVQDVEKHFVDDMGGRRPCNGDQGFEEGCGENEDMEVEGDRDPDRMVGDDDLVGMLLQTRGRHLDSSGGENTDSFGIAGSSLPSSQGQQRGLYDEEEHGQQFDEFWQTAVVRWSPDLDKRLFPVRLPQTSTQAVYVVPMQSGRTRDAHANAVKYLRQALKGARNMTPALLPLVQLLLAVGDVKGAVEEIDRCCDSPHLLPLGIKTLLLESFDRKDSRLISQSYEAMLDINPSCASALSALIRLHAAGRYKTQALVECIAGALDVEKGDLEVWQQLAACLLVAELQLDNSTGSGRVGETGAAYNQDGDGVGGVQDASFEVWLKQTWKERSRWWAHKHFHETSIRVEQQHDGDWRRIAYKAACSTHIMGPGTVYEKVVCKALEELKAESLLALVQLHNQRAHARLAQAQAGLDSANSP